MNIDSKRISDMGWPATGRDGAGAANRRLIAGSVAAVIIGGGTGFFYGGAVIDSLVRLWTLWLMPAFINIYLFGVALCT